ncbi:Ig-like domain-containing protein [Rubritalea spongiae]|uniref:Ig-like domain-containing protein n=1 Tax=Rubritalea spongiae TaxID=430797 RepID=A0ABW5E1V5_9BACT
MNKTQGLASVCIATLCSMAHANLLYEDTFDNDGLSSNTGVGGGAVNKTIQGHSWTDDGDATFNTAGTSYTRRAILYSENSFQSDTGFRLTVNFTTGSIGDLAAHNLSFGLVSTDTDLSSYTGFNPFLTDTSVYSVGANVTADIGEASRGLNFTDGSTTTTLDQSGTRAQFKAGESCEVTLEIGIGGYWCYRIDGEYEASGVLLEGFDLSKSYHVVVYGQDDHGGGKTIESLSLEAAPAAGERAAHIRGTWAAGGEAGVEELKDFRTMDFAGVGFNSGATQSALHFVPHKLLESLSEGDVDENGERINLVVPPWGDLTLDEPENDTFLEEILEIKAAGFQVQSYTNCKNFVGDLGDSYTVFVERWKEWCDTDPTAQAFIQSQPFHTGIWNRTTQQYEDADSIYPDRKYMFCYAEFVLKDYSLRYGHHFDRWIFDSGDDIPRVGDNGTSGLIEEQRLFQAFTNAVRAGNPDIPVAYNLGRSNIHYDGFPFHIAVQFEDFTFGHAYGGNTDHGSKENGAYDRNYNHVIRMMETNGYVHNGGNWTWDDLIVGNFHSKLATTSWSDGPFQAWEEADFLKWNEEALIAGGSMTWGGSTESSQGVKKLRGWAYDLLKANDDHLAAVQFPGAPNWARAYTILPEATIGQAYYHVLVEEVDFWDPEGDAIDAVWFQDGAPAWLSIAEDANNPGHWILSGTPTENAAVQYAFNIRARDVNLDARSRSIELQVNANDFNFADTSGGAPVWISNTLTLPDAHTFETFSHTLVRGVDFEDFDGDALTITKASGPSWLSLVEIAPNLWQLNGTPASHDDGLNTMTLNLHDGNATTQATIEINVTNPQFLAMETNSINGGAYWSTAAYEQGLTDELSYHNKSNNFNYRSLMYTSQSFQSDAGFRLTVNATTGSIGNPLAHNFSFGLISADTDLSSYAGFNPFQTDTSIYSLGVNLTTNAGAAAQGLNYTNGSTVTTLDQSGTHAQFVAGSVNEIQIEVGTDGLWRYFINGVEEASGVIPEGFDLTKSYHVAFYGQDDDGGGKSVQSMVLDLNNAPTGSLTQVSVDEDSSVNFSLTATDLEGDDLSYALTSAPSHGSISGTAPNLTYTPNPNYEGSDSFSYLANDGLAESEVTVVHITVHPVNDAPSIDNPPASGAISVRGAYDLSIAGSASDIDGDSLSYSVVSGPSWLNVASDGTLSGSPGFTDAGTNSWVIQVTDGQGGSALINYDIEVTSQILMGYDFDAGSPAATLFASEFSASDFSSPMDISYTTTIGDNTGKDATGASFGNASTLGAVGIGVDDATTASFANAVNGDDYMSFTVTPEPGRALQLEGISFLGVKKANSSVDEYAVTDASGNLIGSTVNITSVFPLTGDYDGVLVDLSGTAYAEISQATEFRIYAWGRNTTSTGNTLAAIDKVTLHGSVQIHPLANWTLDDGGSAVALDYSGNGFDAAIANASSVAGVDGTALDFNGSNAEVTLPASAFASIDQEITLSFWAYGASNQARNDTLFAAEDSSGNRVLNIHLPWSNSNVYWDAGWNAGYDRIYKVATAAQFKDSWSHWVFVKNATTGTMEIYHNGTLFHSGASKSKSIAGIASATLGAQLGTSHYAGAIDDVILYNVALTAQEVAELYSSYE